jgi:predicted negative regulator of RcsB-dependent stress response
VRAQTRHQLKQDSFSRVTLDAAEKTVDWTVEHQGKLIVAAIVLLIIVGGVFGGWYYLNQQDLKASVLLGQAVRTMETPLRPAGVPAEPGFPSFGSLKERAEAAQKAFHEVVDKYPHTHSADMAHYFLGVTSAQLGDNAAAERDLKQVASNSSEDLASLAKLALASVYRDTNRTKDAIDTYNQLINKPTRTVGKVMAQLELAATYQDANQPAEAKRIYEQVQKENPSTDAAQIASTKLQALK